jgi:hypothetical protein
MRAPRAATPAPRRRRVPAWRSVATCFSSTPRLLSREPIGVGSRTGSGRDRTKSVRLGRPPLDAALRATLLDEGMYLCSTRTIYGILAARDGGVRERRDELTHPPYAKPER